MTTVAVLAAVSLLLSLAAAASRSSFASVLLVSSLFSMTGAVVEGLSRPKPTAWETRWTTNEVEVLWWQIAEGKAVYAVVLRPGEPEPRYYSLPWSRELAENLSRLRDRMEKGHRVFIPYPFAPSLENRQPLVPHDLPPPALPPKAGQDRAAPPKVEM